MYSHDNLEATFDELLDGDDTVLIEIELLEDLVGLLPRYSFLRLAVLPAHQLVHRHYDLAQFAASYAPVTIYVVQFEGPPQFFHYRTPQQHRQRHQKVLKFEKKKKLFPLFRIFPQYYG